MTSFKDFARAQWSTLPVVPTTASTTGGTYIVTGANTGLGLECAKHFVRLGAKRVILAVRSIQRGETAAAAIHKATGRQDVCQVWQLDLASLDSVENFAKRLDTLDRIDALIENASIALDTFTLSEGVETTVTVNVLGTMLLAIRAMPKLRESASRHGIKPHLVIVSGMTAFDCKGALDGINGDLFEALSKKEDNKRLSGSRYPLTKLLQVYATREMASLFPEPETGVVINVMNPGVCITDLDRNIGGMLKVQIFLGRRLLGRTAEEGSRTLLHAAVAGPESHGKYVSDCVIKEYAVPEWISGQEGQRMQRRVWDDMVKTLNAKGHRVDAVLSQ
ncbi:hypothetical protein NM208_g11050 [Fusarium decemcellulare]|uniref:Uncharacterized protein n=1 Tax=Fusarium decemcellulare TaxID=57161 RepID=A0ACC1RVP2_9HYPO|nr:hypothetical protein NM208_g11050 [Fusarium decemcellulare]